MKILFLLLASLIFITGCGKKSDEEYMKSAKEKIDKKQITEAVKDYENLVKDYPESELAPEALYQLGSLYQNKMVGGLKDEESLQKAVNTYKMVSDKYPKSSQAEKSLFMAGFIEANDLKKYDDATATYKKFLKQYPQSEMATAIRDELDYMGLTPEQILEKKTVTSK